MSYTNINMNILTTNTISNNVITLLTCSALGNTLSDNIITISVFAAAVHAFTNLEKEGYPVPSK